jgi:hypothetical protein
VSGFLWCLRCLRTKGQVDLLHGRALHRRDSAGRPQGGQQQRRLGQARPAASLPVRAVGVRGDGAQVADEGGPVRGPVSGVLG